MKRFESTNFVGITQKIGEKSLFTERQLEIILRKLNKLEVELKMSRGSYYRQVGQAREKLVSFCYTLILLRSLEILSKDDIVVISKVADQISVVEGEVGVDDIVGVVDEMIHRICKL